MTDYIAKVEGKNGFYVWELLEGNEYHSISGPHSEDDVDEIIEYADYHGANVVDKDFILTEGLQRTTTMTPFEQQVFEHVRQFFSSPHLKPLTMPILLRVVDGFITMTNYANDSHEHADAQKIIRQLETIFNIHVQE